MSSYLIIFSGLVCTRGQAEEHNGPYWLWKSLSVWSTVFSTFSEKFIPASTSCLDNMTDYAWKRPSMIRVINRAVHAKAFPLSGYKSEDRSTCPLSNTIHFHKGSNSVVRFPQGFGFINVFSLEWWWLCVIKLCKNQDKRQDFITSQKLPFRIKLVSGLH